MRSKAAEAGRHTEAMMLMVLFSTNLNPRADPSVARKCETRDGLRPEFLKMARAARAHQRRRSSGNATTLEIASSPALDRRFDCLLLVRAVRGGESNQAGTMPKEAE